jgi:hypothetical protein
MATGHGTNRAERGRLPRWRSVWGSSCGTAASSDLARTCNSIESRALGVGTLIRRGEYLGRCPYRRNMAGDARGDLRLPVCSSVGRVEVGGAERRCSDRPVGVAAGASRRRRGEGERREGNAKTAGWGSVLVRLPESGPSCCLTEFWGLNLNIVVWKYSHKIYKIFMVT